MRVCTAYQGQRCVVDKVSGLKDELEVLKSRHTDLLSTVRRRLYDQKQFRTAVTQREVRTHLSNRRAAYSVNISLIPLERTSVRNWPVRCDCWRVGYSCQGPARGRE